MSIIQHDNPNIDLLLDEFMDFYEKDDSLNEDLQILETLEFMKYSIPFEFADYLGVVKPGDKFFIFPMNYLYSLMEDGYKKNSDFIDIIQPLYDEYKVVNKKFSYNFLKKKSKANKISWGFLSSFLLAPEKIFNGVSFFYGDYKPSKLDEGIDLVQQVQIDLVKDMMNKYKSNLDICRLVPYNFYHNKLISINSKNSISTDSSCNDSFVSLLRGVFGNLFSHVGFFEKPQIGKWEFPVEWIYNKDALDYVVETYPIDFLRKGEEKIQDLEDQVLISSYLNTSIINDSLKIKREAKDIKRLNLKLEKRVSSMQHQELKLKNFNSYFKGEIRKREMQIKNLGKLAGNNHNGNGKDCKGNKCKYRKKIDYAEGIVSEYRELGNEFKSMDDLYNRIIRDKEKEIAKLKRFIGTESESKYDVSFEKCRGYFIDHPDSERHMNVIKERLEDGGGRKIILGSKSHGGYSYLKQKHSEYNLFFKVKFGDYVIGFTIEERNHGKKDLIQFLQFDNHDRYMDTWANNAPYRFFRERGKHAKK